MAKKKHNSKYIKNSSSQHLKHWGLVQKVSIVCCIACIIFCNVEWATYSAQQWHGRKSALSDENAHGTGYMRHILQAYA